MLWGHSTDWTWPTTSWRVGDLLSSELPGCRCWSATPVMSAQWPQESGLDDGGRVSRADTGSPWPDAPLAHLPCQCSPFPAPASHAPYTRGSPPAASSVLTRRSRLAQPEGARLLPGSRGPGGHGDELPDSVACRCGRAPAVSTALPGGLEREGAAAQAIWSGRKAPWGRTGTSAGGEEAPLAPCGR